jgi:membrane-associated phospholipid phosphatase
MNASVASRAVNRGALVRIDRAYRFSDLAMQAYLFLVGALILFFHGNHVPGYQRLLVAHGAGIALIHALIYYNARFPENRVVSFFRHFYPLLLFLSMYRECELLNLMFVHHYLDPVFIALEERLFGFQPAVAFMTAFPYPVVSEFFYVSYFSYYVMIGAVGLALFFRNREQFWHYLAILSFVLYVCYLIFICLPVAGPPAFYMEMPRFVGQHQLPYYPLEFPPGVTSGPLFHLMAVMYRNFETGGAAFPSSHVAVAICTLYFTWQYLPRIRHLHLVAVVALSLATVYCRYHYAVDVLAGAATAALMIPLGEWLYRRRP